jgi:hypothetical protein
MRATRPIAVLALATAVAATAAPATAAPATGAVTISFGGQGKAAEALRASAVKVAAITPAKRSGKRVKLPVARIAVGSSSARAVLRGGIRFRSGKRVVALRSLRLKLGAKRATVTAKVGKRRVTVFTAKPAKGKPKLDRSDVAARLAGAKLGLTPNGARTLRRGLGVDALPAGALGTLGVNARRKGTSGGGGGGNGNGPGGDGGPKSGPISAEPPVLSRPPSAVAASGVAITWYPRDSWIRYVSSGVGPQDGFFASGGAVKAAPADTASHPCSDVAYAGSGQFDYRYDFTAKSSSWYDPVSGKAALYGQGSVRFRWEGHTIDLTAADPEIEINGATSRAIFRFDGSDGTAIPEQRAVLMTLSMAGQPTSSGGGAFGYSAMRGTLTEDGEAVFAGFYPAGDGFGCVSVSFATS